MNATQALARLHKILGKRAAIQDRRRPSSEAQRNADAARRQELRRIKVDAEAAMNTRRAAILLADADYQRLLREYRTALQNLEKAPWPRYRYCAGRDQGFCFSVDAEADNLADLVAKVEAKYSAKEPT